MKSCELCEAPARIFCESDQASLCWGCDVKVHGANFLVARHSRNLLCQACQSPTPWSAAGAKLGPTVSLCATCSTAATVVSLPGDEIDLHSDGGRSSDGSDYDGDDDDDGDDGSSDEEEEEGENQVVPRSFTPPPPEMSSSSGDDEFNPLPSPDLGFQRNASRWMERREDNPTSGDRRVEGRAGLLKESIRQRGEEENGGDEKKRTAGLAGLCRLKKR